MTYEFRPYRKGVGILVRQIKWDVSPLAIKTKEKIKKWKNIYRNQKALILCNGPSLNKVDFNMLKEREIFCFGLNKINLLFKKNDFRPSSIVAVNPYVIDQNKEFYSETEIPLFLNKDAKKIVHNSNAIFIKANAYAGTFSKKPYKGMPQGHTVTYVALQLAYYMGFEKVGLVGADHNFTTKGPANKVVKSSDFDSNHFDPNYFAGGVEWQLPDLVASEYYYQIADLVYKENNRKIVNCTEGGDLEIFEKQSLEDFFDDK